MRPGGVHSPYLRAERGGSGTQAKERQQEQIEMLWGSLVGRVRKKAELELAGSRAKGEGAVHRERNEKPGPGSCSPGLGPRGLQ